MDDCDAFPSCLLHHLHLLRYFSSRRRASVGGQHNEYGQAKLPPNIRRVEQVQKELQQTPYRLDQQRRGIVLRALRETCLDRRWRLLAAHVRNNHVHVVVSSRSSTGADSRGVEESGQPATQRGGNRQAGSQTMDPPWKYLVSVERGACRFGNPLRYGRPRPSASST